jgi:hypothetical protein
MAGAACCVLSRAIIRHHGEGSVLARAVGKDVKSKLSVALYLAGAPRWQDTVDASVGEAATFSFALPSKT